MPAMQSNPLTPFELSDGELFDLAPTALLLEDFSEVYCLLADWRAAGVTDIEAFLASRPDAIADFFSRIRVIRGNQRSLSLYEAASAQERAAAASTIYAREDNIAPIAEIASLWRGERNFSVDMVNHTLTGRRLHVRLNVNLLADVARPWDRVLLAVEDLSAQRAAQEALRESESYARGLFELSPVSLWVEDFSEVKALLDAVRDQGITDFRTFIDVHPEFVVSCMERIRVIDMNKATISLYGASSKAELLARLSEVFRDEMARGFGEQLLNSWNGALFQTRETLNYSLRGDPIHLHMQWAVLPGHEANWDLVQVAMTDITARKKAESYLEFLGKHDALTKLRNRAFYDDEIARLNRRGPFPIGVLSVDLNGLKQVNDEYGHAAGDSLLRRAGEALKKAVGENMQVARVGGDEFCCLLPRFGEAEMAVLAESIRMVVDLNNQFYQGPKLSLAIGTAVCTSAGTLDRALRLADDAMYAAKRVYYKENHDTLHDGPR